MISEVSGGVTELLRAWRGGDASVLPDLMATTYRRLKQIASHLLERERSGHTLQTTDLVHEAYLRLAALDRVEWRDRVHFYAMSARIMRRVLVDNARRRGSAKRGGGRIVVAVDDRPEPAIEQEPDLAAVHSALEALAEHDPQRARIVELRFFGGLNRDEIAEVLGISSATVSRRWRSARAWLLHELSAQGG